MSETLLKHIYESLAKDSQSWICKSRGSLPSASIYATSTGMVPTFQKTAELLHTLDFQVSCDNTNIYVVINSECWNYVTNISNNNNIPSAIAEWVDKRIQYLKQQEQKQQQQEQELNQLFVNNLVFV